MENVFETPPVLSQAHRALPPKPGAGQSPRPFIVCIYRFPEKEKTLYWVRRRDFLHAFLPGHERSFREKTRWIQISQAKPLLKRH